MAMFPLWFLEWLIIGSLVLCGAGAMMLVVFLIVDSKGNKIW
ncbi:hypothetical protein K227x_61530 [Rubripirellula lacrimiformis]|uniref:Uncharacterized protein n=1 Tax=Rubripirellula lacrimiformis TaxID=1930273 RepID=A0A517NKR0_9BACT|nr:hypothetical protein [Rubripirellula lacrimiformis]QDT07725.1 hypothetical protein K227x_61530 [Rubripirellula lacrimiformis]